MNAMSGGLRRGKMQKPNKHIKNRPQNTWAGLATARLLCERYMARKHRLWN